MIGVFDSGLGGLRVLKSLCQQMPNESFVYLGDTARLPYGIKSPDTIKKYLTQNIHFLLTHKVKAIVVACNSASSVVESGEEYPVPVYNVITPSAKKAVELSMDEKVGVIGTRATVQQKVYIREMQKINPHISVYQQACPLLVPLVEEGWTDDPLGNLIVYRYVNPIVQAGIDTLILGCTHYPVLEDSITKVTGSKIKLISSADAVAEQLKSDLESGKLKAHEENAKIKLFTTDLNEHFEIIAKRLFDPLPLESFQVVNYS